VHPQPIGQKRPSRRGQPLMRAAARALLPPSLLAALLLTLLAPATAEAVEFRLDGYFRSRGRLFDTLSLDRQAEDSEHVRAYWENRLLLTPHLRVNANVHVFLELDVFDALRFGTNPEILAAVGAEQESGEAFSEPEALSESLLPGADYRESMFVRRAWAELYTPYVDLKIGRMGSHWGMGLFANDGSCDDCSHGDVVDRIMISTSRIDPVRISLAADTRAEGFVNRNDDTHSFLLSGGYLGEVHRVGALVRWTRQPSNKFNLVWGDLWGQTKLGPLSMELEALILWGQAPDTDIGVEDLRILAGGGAFKAGLAVSPWSVGLQLGLATGDKDPTDNRWHTLRMDRDHNVGLLMFEQPMPVFARGDAADSENQNVDASRAITGEGVSNAFYLRPDFHIEIRDDLRAGVSLLAAFPVVAAAFEDEPKVYGVEIGLDATWLAFSAFELGGRTAFFFPGPVYGASRPFTFGGELRALVRF
jgi:hypothetical protein